MITYGISHGKGGSENLTGLLPMDCVTTCKARGIQKAKADVHLKVITSWATPSTWEAEVGRSQFEVRIARKIRRHPAYANGHIV